MPEPHWSFYQNIKCKFLYIRDFKFTGNNSIKFFSQYVFSFSQSFFLTYSDNSLWYL